jgi:hypothetical protein
MRAVIRPEQIHLQSGTPILYTALRHVSTIIVHASIDDQQV